MTTKQKDAWAKGVVYGCCRVVPTGENYPVLLAFWVRAALAHIQRRQLRVHPMALAFAENWCERVEKTRPRKAS